MRQYHIQCDEGEVGEYVLLPGDPGRSEVIARHFDDAHKVMSNREFTTYTGTIDGVPVSVCSTGIGCPSTAIAVEELIKIGAKTFIRVGTCGSLQPEVHRADLVVMNAAVRTDGTSQQYVPLAFPAVADFDTTLALRDAARDSGMPTHVGTSISSDAFYCEGDAQGLPMETELKLRWQAWLKAGALAAEMECATLFTIAAVRKVRAGAVCVSVNQAGADVPEGTELPLDALIDVAVNGIRKLIAADSTVRV